MTSPGGRAAVADPKVAVTLFGIERSFGGDLRALVEVAEAAEDAGIHQVVLPDHVLIGSRTDRYPFGAFPAAPEQPWPEPLTVLAAVAARTTRIRLSTGVLVSPLRPAALLAKTVATLDALSGGRVDLGVGTGWQREEYEASGVPFGGRTARMEEQIRACQALWASAPTSFSSPTVSLDEVWCRPAPAQPGGVPVWFGGPGVASVGARIAELGAGWLPIAGTTVAELAAGMAVIDDEVARAGRDPSDIGVRVTAPVLADGRGRPDLDRTIDAARAYVDAGAGAVSFALVPFVTAPAQLAPVLDALHRGLTRR